MKTYLSLLLAVAASGLAFGVPETAYTTPVGYETFSINTGFNFVGVRLQNAPIATGTLESFSTSPNRVTDNDVDLGALIVSGTYVLEIRDGSGIIQEVTSATGTSLNVAADLSSLTYPVSYKLRPAATVASVFGNAVADMKIDIGGGGVVGADQLWFFNGSGYTKIYYDEYGDGDNEIPGWYNVVGGASVDATAMNLIYADGFIISSAAGRDVTISGEVKTDATEMNLNTGFNFVSSVGPVGVTLGSAFGETLSEVQASGLAIGGGGVVGADQLWFFNGTGYTKVYYDEYGDGDNEIPGWYNVIGGASVPTSTEIPAGYIISAAAPKDVLSGLPESYDNL